MFRKSILALGLCALVASAATASTASAELLGRETVSIPVRFDDLNLATPAGVASFRMRIDRAARKICGPTDIFELSRWYAVSQCRDEVSSRIRQDVDLAIASTVNTRLTLNDAAAR